MPRPSSARNYRSQAFEIDGQILEIKVPVLYVDDRLVSKEGIVRHSRLWHFLFVQDNPPLSARVGAAAVGVYTALLQHANWETGLCNPSHRRLAEMLASSEKTIRRHLQTLCKHGLLVRLPRIKGRGGAGGRACTDWYYLNQPVIRKTPQRVRVVREQYPVDSPEYCNNPEELTEYSQNPGDLAAKGGRFSRKNTGETTEELDTINDSWEKDPFCSNREERVAAAAAGNPLRIRLHQGGMKKRMIDKIMTQCKPAEVATACDNADALATDGILANWAGYVVRACFGALEEESTIRPTRRAKKQRTTKAAAAAEREAILAQARAERRSERQLLAAKRFGDLDRWEEIDLAELE